MLLNHYTAFLEKYMQGKLGSLVSAKGISFTFTSLDYQANEMLLPMPLHQTANIFVGSDNTPETGDSYCPKKEILSGLYIAFTRSVQDNSDGSHSSIVNAICTNTSTEPITIGEIGFRTNVSYGGGSTDVVLDRTPLGTPLTIQPGEVGRIVYTITMA
jgi:hypothetical protein